MAWRALKKMRRNPEQFFDVTLQPLLFTAMFAYIFGGAISGDVAELPAADHPRHPRPDRADRRAWPPACSCARTWTRASSTGSSRCRSRGSRRWPGRWSPTCCATRSRPTLTFVIGHRDGLPARRRRRSACSARSLLAIVAGWSLAWIFTWLGTIARSAQARAGHLDDDHVPADVPVQRVRPGRRPCRAGCRRSSRSTRSRTWSPPSATWPTTAPSPPRSAGRCSACAVVVAIFAPLSVRSYKRHL